MALGSCTNLVMAEKLNRMMKEGFGVGMDDCQLTVARREKDHPTSLLWLWQLSMCHQEH